MSAESETERRKQLFIDWCLSSLREGLFRNELSLSEKDAGDLTPADLAEARAEIEKERGPELGAMVKLIEMAELGEREAAAKYFDECGSKLTAQVLRDGRHRE